MVSKQYYVGMGELAFRWTKEASNPALTTSTCMYHSHLSVYAGYHIPSSVNPQRQPLLYIPQIYRLMHQALAHHAMGRVCTCSLFTFTAVFFPLFFTTQHASASGCSPRRPWGQGSSSRMTWVLVLRPASVQKDRDAIPSPFLAIGCFGGS